MALTIAEKLQRQREKQKQSMERARAKQIAKMNDPEERQKRFKKQLQQQERQRQRQIERLNDPEYQKKQRDKQQQRIERQKAKPVAKKPTKKIASKGLKGRTPMAEERRIMDAIGRLPCIACWLHGRENPVISLHHVFGRVGERAHAYVLPLCCYHHDTLLEAEKRAQYPDMIPIHAKGKYGGKAQWKIHNGTEIELLFKVYNLAGLPLELLENIYPKYSEH
ncbi:Ref family protein [Vibrio alginolyticus]|uniref:Ref family recombination enhancement nuclease n=1 Tax=Vibrio TaxID=662 RepID=UPI000B2BE54F|nr:MULTISPECIES: Ref family recombination enhancement nuclease [Vibrio]MCR9453779.1 Ref family protein [Vibrio alginolyticus]MCR9462378.1 Ref family protein [Vibrio alginolyticus]MCR9505898.1 Ref family protein [Vibrio alginolyticus]MCR9520212.1 Ref family protein [Vibrio alginolyticus]MCR9594579.1 Ref family protein [Vibrio alginolyticus]